MKSTKKVFLLSIMSMLLCVAMLIGTTFAWFTDNVTSGTNKIVAGNLDIELEYSKDGTNWATVEGKTDLFSDVTLWEPGATSVVYLKLTNNGTLALKYNLAITATGGEFTNVAGETKNLKDALKFAQFAGPDLVTYATREEAVAATSDVAIGLNDYAQANHMAAEDESYITLVVTMPTTVGNEFNYKTGTQAPEISLSITLTATQYTAESDSFDDSYDAAAPWLGGLDDTALAANTDDTAKTVTIETAEQLASFAKAVNNNTKDYSTFTIKLAKDLDLNNVRWTPISATANHSFVKFDGQGHTIKNLKVEQPKNAGLFGTLSGGDIENLIIDGATISGNDYAGAIIGTAYDSYIKNCEVKNATVTVVPYLKDNGTEYDGGAKAGAIVGYLTAQSNVSVENCKVNTATISAYRDLGGLVGYAQGAAKVTDNTISNVKLNYLFAAPYDGNTPNQNMGDYYGRYDAASIIASGNIGSAVKGEANVLTTAAELVMFANAVNGGNSFEGKTVKLGADIDLAGIDWTPIGGNTMASYPGITFAGTFDGQNHTISNLKSSSNAPGYACAGLFGAITGKVQNLTLTNVDITSTHYAGAIVAYASNCGEIRNCHVIGGKVTSVPEWTGTEYDNGDKVGGINGYGAALIDNCSVENLTVTGYRDIGGIAGAIGIESSTITVSNNTVLNVTLVQDNTNGYKSAMPDTIAEIIGRDMGTTKSNNTATGGVIKHAIDATPDTLDDIMKVIKDNTIVTLGEGSYDVLKMERTPAEAGKMGGTLHNVTFVAEEGKTVIFKGVQLRNAQNCTIEGVTFYADQATDVVNTFAANSYAPQVDNAGAKASIMNADFRDKDGSNNITIKNCVFTVSPENASYTAANYRAIDLSNNKHQGNKSLNLTVEGCTFDCHAQNYINLNYNGKSGEDLVTVKNNTFGSSASGAYSTIHSVINATGSKMSVDIEGNTFYNWGRYIIGSSMNAADNSDIYTFTVKGNIFNNEKAVGENSVQGSNKVGLINIKAKASNNLYKDVNAFATVEGNTFLGALVGCTDTAAVEWES